MFLQSWSRYQWLPIIVCKRWIQWKNNQNLQYPTVLDGLFYCLKMKHITPILNSLWSSGAIWRHGTLSSSVHITASRLFGVRIDYMNLCRFIVLMSNLNPIINITHWLICVHFGYIICKMLAIFFKPRCLTNAESHGLLWHFRINA